MANVTVNHKDNVPNLPQKETYSSVEKSSVQDKKDITEKKEAITNIIKSEEHQSTSETTQVLSKITEQKKSDDNTKNVEKSKNIMSSIKNFFKF